MPFYLWFSAFVLVLVASHISTQNQLENATSLQHEDEWDSSFLLLRSSLLSYLQEMRPYSLQTQAEDYPYLPKPRHRRPSRLLKLLKASFDPFWMSIEKPTEGRFEDSDNKTSHLKLKEIAAEHRQKLEEDLEKVDFGSLPSDVASAVRSFMVTSASCDLRHQWVDMGPTFWPRWLRQTDCGGADGEKSCSFPRGMECVQAQTTQIKILTWYCVEGKDGEERPGRNKAKVSESDRGGGSVVKCLWRPVAYPVVTACMCSCQ